MKVVVCIKQVPDTNEVKIDPKTGTLIREGVPSIINHDDKNALEGALQLKDQQKDVEVVVVTMGPPQAKVALIEALAMGADRGILVSDRAFAGADTLATSRALAATIKKIGDVDIIFCGRQAIDGDTAQVGPQIAEHLNYVQVTYVQDYGIDGDTLTVTKALEDGYSVVEVKTPCVLTAIKELNQPRYMSVKGIFEAYNEKTIDVWNAAQIEVDLDKVGLKGSPTSVFKTFTPAPKGKGIMLEGCDRNTVLDLINRLKDKKAL
ncbi:electron transfer flavoprotein subunit beta [Clostridium sediminicola]|uniref:electron transfer flavoprotein subunit beta n=1 Tax=Clostridium sediminicola TaxID=3114879 RepID=UPI0031F26C14